MPFGSQPVPRPRGKSPRNSMILVNKDNEMNFGRNKVEKEINGLSSADSHSDHAITNNENNDKDEKNSNDSNSNNNSSYMDSNFIDNDNIEVGISKIMGGDAKILTTRDSFVFQIDHSAISDNMAHRQKDNYPTNVEVVEGKGENIEINKKKNLSISLSASDLGEDDRTYVENDWTDDDFAALSVSVRTGDIPLKGEADGSEEEEEEESGEEDDEEGEEEDDEALAAIEDENSRKIHK